jgi:hypothetical protein
MIDMDVGQKDGVEAFDLVPPKLPDQMRDGGERPGIDQQGGALPPVEPGADELAEAFKGRLIEIDAEEVFHGALPWRVVEEIMISEIGGRGKVLSPWFW